MSTGEDPFLVRLAAMDSDDLAPVGNGRRPGPGDPGGRSHDGIMAVPLEDLALCSAAELAAMRPAQRSHRSRRLGKAAEDGTLPAAYVQALQARGVLPQTLAEQAS